VIASLQGGSPFAEKVFQPDSNKSRVENRPSTFNYAWDTVDAVDRGSYFCHCPRRLL
jgi:hypothetical protein